MEIRSGAALLVLDRNLAITVSSSAASFHSTHGGRKPVTVSAVALLGDEPLFMHVIRNGAEVTPQREPAAPEVRLTGRQAEVLALLNGGLSAKRIAKHLGLAEPTIRNHIRAILVALGAHSQLEARARAQKLGLIE